MDVVAMASSFFLGGRPLSGRSRWVGRGGLQRVENKWRARDEMSAFESLEREALGRALSHIDQEPRPAPALVLVGIDVERCAADLAQPQVTASDRELAFLEADRRRAVAATAGLEERERPMGGLEAIDHLKRRSGCPDSRPTIANRSLHL